MTAAKQEWEPIGNRPRCQWCSLEKPLYARPYGKEKKGLFLSLDKGSIQNSRIFRESRKECSSFDRYVWGWAKT